MRVGRKHYRTIWLKPDDARVVEIIDQRALPHDFVIEEIRSVDEMATAIRDMHVRGAGLIGAAAAYGMYLASVCGEDLHAAAEKLIATRPTAINLRHAVDRQLACAQTRRLKAVEFPPCERGGEAETTIASTRRVAEQIANEDAEHCRAIGEHGVRLINEIAQRKNGQRVNVLTHCNAGWLAFVDYGSATSPIYAAHDAGVPVHVWIDETRPRNQGSKLTAWELAQHGVPHTLITDNAGGHLMQHGEVDLVIVGTDRTTYTGDVANKIGTYLKALAAHDNGVPFYVALPSSSFDWQLRDGHDIPIEQRSPDEVKRIDGVLIAPEATAAANYGFDVTSRRLVTGLITERGICRADEESILRLFPEHRH